MSKWPMVALGEVAGINPRQVPALEDDDEVAFVPMSELDAETGSTSRGIPRLYAEVAKGYTSFRNGDILLAKITPCFENMKIGQASLSHEIGAGSTEFHVLRPNGSRLDTRYLLHFLRRDEILRRGELRMTGSGGQRRIPLQFLISLEIPLPPLDEQRRIAAVLDHVETLRIRNNQEQLLLDTLPQHLFVTMFGDPDTATSTIELGKITSLSGGRNLVGDDPLADSRYRVLKISAVTSGRFKPEESKPLPGNYEPPAGHLVRSGDLLMSRANTAELVGAVALADRPPSNLALPDKIWRFEWLESGSNAVFYHALLSTLSIRRRISLLSSGSGGSMKNVSKAKLARMRIPHIPVAQQEEFARLVNGIASRSQQVRQRGGLLDEMASSLRSRAFRGEL